MASLQSLLAVLFIFAIAFDPSSVDAKFSNSMYFYWGAQNSAILGNGDDLQLMLDQTSGNNYLPTIHHIIGFYVSWSQGLLRFCTPR